MNESTKRLSVITSVLVIAGGFSLIKFRAPESAPQLVQGPINLALTSLDVSSKKNDTITDQKADMRSASAETGIENPEFCLDGESVLFENYPFNFTHSHLHLHGAGEDINGWLSKLHALLEDHGLEWPRGTLLTDDHILMSNLEILEAQTLPWIQKDPQKAVELMEQHIAREEEKLITREWMDYLRDSIDSQYQLPVDSVYEEVLQNIGDRYFTQVVPYGIEPGANDTLTLIAYEQSLLRNESVKLQSLVYLIENPNVSSPMRDLAARTVAETLNIQYNWDYLEKIDWEHEIFARIEQLSSADF